MDMFLRLEAKNSSNNKKHNNPNSGTGAQMNATQM